MKTQPSVLVILFVISNLLNQAQRPTLWGTTSAGGAYNKGTIFNYDINTGAFVHIYDFGAGTDGSKPVAALLQASNGLLYGTTNSGGLLDGGTIFSYNIATGTETDLHDFGGGDGYGPWGSLIQVGDSLLYGATPFGGAGSAGLIFSYNIYTNTYSDLHDFLLDSTPWPLNGFFGPGPYGSLMLANNDLLYGTTAGGGPDTAGLIFSYDIHTATYAIVHYFGNGNDGRFPFSSLIQANNGLLYGTTFAGGGVSNNEAGISENGLGTIFSYDVNADTEIVLYSFNGNGGANPYSAPIQSSNGLLYGTTLSQEGSIFSYDITTGAYKDIYYFGETDYDGASPYSPVMQASDGQLYGTTEYGGFGNNNGTLFKYNISAGKENIPHNFDSITGVQPYGGLIEIDLPTGISPLVNSADNLQIFPNPTTGQFNILLPDNQSGYPAGIFNVMGQKIEQLILTAGQNTLSLSNQPAGMYFINVQTENGSSTGKILVTK